MSDNNPKINQLQEKLDLLLKRQDDFSQEINKLGEEIYKLQADHLENPLNENHETIINQPKTENDLKPKYQIRFDKPIPIPPDYSAQNNSNPPGSKSNIEKFIGENLINKIGIIITIIGVAIGAKYSIDHQLISPLTRIIMGYIMAIGLLGIGFKLKTNYDNYSAVLVSGAMAIMYLITYFAYSFYQIIPQTVAFSLMVAFTIFTVWAAHSFNKQVIAHIGLVGAYAVPFILSDGSGNVLILFSYINY